MAIYIPQAMPIPEWVFSNGNPARGVHPETLDRASTHLIAGYGFHFPALIVGDAAGVSGIGSTLRLPILLPPWTGAVSVAIKGACEFSDDVIELTLVEWAPGGEANIELATVTLGAEEMGVYGAAVTDWSEWGAIPWVGAGSLGGDPTMGKGLVECTPANTWRTCYVVATLTGGQIHGLWARPVASATPVPVGG